MARPEITGQKRYSTGERVRQRYGGRSRNWLPNAVKRGWIPKPVMRIGNRDYWLESELDEHDAKQRAALNKEIIRDKDYENPEPDKLHLAHLHALREAGVWEDDVGDQVS